MGSPIVYRTSGEFASFGYLRAVCTTVNSDGVLMEARIGQGIAYTKSFSRVAGGRSSQHTDPKLSGCLRHIRLHQNLRTSQSAMPNYTPVVRPDLHRTAYAHTAPPDAIIILSF